MRLQAIMALSVALALTSTLQAQVDDMEIAYRIDPSGISLKVNGQVRTCTAAPGTPLAYLLRNDLGLTGTKFACGLEQCGACKVLVDGEAVPSCRLPASEVEGVGPPAAEYLLCLQALHR